jgi:filamentous hemagglutinin family protein
VFNVELYAQVVRDGSIGPSTPLNLTGPNFEIGSELGKLNGHNLFHSFASFNLDKGQTANFSGPPEVENVLARVTGRNVSNIDGTLRSSIANANLYLLNPNGFVFGKNARLDVSGSFYASTANGIRFGEKEDFLVHDKPDSKPVFFSATPDAFGLLGSRATIQIQGSSIVNNTNSTYFYAPNGQIKITTDNSGLTIQNSTLFAPKGQIDSDVNSIDISTTGDIQLINTNIDVSGQKEMGTTAGQVTIRGRQLLANYIAISAQSFGDRNGLIKISTQEKMSLEGSQINMINQGKVTDTQAESGIVLEAGKSLELFCTTTGCDDPSSLDKSQLVSLNQGSGIGGQIKITTPTLKISNGSIVKTSTETNTGRAGDIDIAAKDISIYSGFIESMVDKGENGQGENGQGGNISIHGMDGIDSLTDRVSLSNSLSTKSHISASVALDTAGGKAGKVDLKTHQLLLDGNGSEINSFSYSFSHDESGNAGSIQITADMISLSNEARIITEARSANGGNIGITVRDSLRLFNGSRIITTAYNNGKGGELTISGPRFVILDKSHLTTSANRDRGGDITITANYLIGNIWRNPGLEFYGGDVTTEEQFKEIVQQQDDLIQRKFTDPGYSVIDATSHESIDGNLTFNARRWEFRGLPPLPPPSSGLSLVLNRCSFSKENQSRFTITARDTLPRCPEDLRR